MGFVPKLIPAKEKSVTVSKPRSHLGKKPEGRRSELSSPAPEPLGEDTLLPLTAKQKESFLMLRDLYNSLDKEGTNSVDKQLIMEEVTLSDIMRRKFVIDRIVDFEQEVKEFPSEKQGFLTWQEFLDLLFMHKRRMKQPPVEVVDDEVLLAAEKTPQAAPKRESEAPVVPVASQDNKRTKSTRKVPKEDQDFHVTVPKPFHFFDRERFKGKSITQRKLEEMLAEKKYQEDLLIRHRFKANAIPKSTTEPRYERMAQAREARSEQVKLESQAMTKAREKPFSFYTRDRDFYVNRAKATDENVPEVMKNIKPFKAHPIPEAVKKQMMQGIQEKEDAIREERKRKWAQELIAMSSLPPRMAMHEAEKLKTGTKKPVPSGMQYTYEPPRARPVPDFGKQQHLFQLALEHHKQQKQPTVVRPFSFRETKVRS